MDQATSPGGPEDNPKGLPWGRFVGEAAVIVFGILIALAADAWWDDQRERREEQVVLAQLLSEFRDNDVQLDSIVAIHERSRAAASVLISVGKGDIRLPPDSLRELVWQMDNPWTFNPKRGALESLVTSGRLSLIEDDSLRVELASWSGLLDDYAEDEVFSMTYAQGAQYDFFASRLSWADIYSPAPESDRVLDALNGDRELAGIAAYREGYFPSILGEAALLKDASARIQRRIEGSLR